MPEFYSWGRLHRERSERALRPTLAVIAREGGQSSIPETARLEPKSRGVLDAPVKPGHDSGAYPGIRTGSDSYPLMKLE